MSTPGGVDPLNWGGGRGADSAVSQSGLLAIRCVRQLPQENGGMGTALRATLPGDSQNVSSQELTLAHTGLT